MASPNTKRALLVSDQKKKAVTTAEIHAKAMIDKSMAKIMMPKTAKSFYKIKKGLFLSNRDEARNLAFVMSNQDCTEMARVGSESHSMQKSAKLMSAYGEFACDKVAVRGAVRAPA